jgi:hypothetical protein
MCEIDAKAIVTIVEPGDDEQAKIEQTQADLDEALKQDEQASE